MVGPEGIKTWLDGTALLIFAGGVMLPLLYWALQWLTFTFSTMVPTPGGVGGSEAAFLLLYAPFISPDTLGPVMVIWRLSGPERSFMRPPDVSE